MTDQPKRKVNIEVHPLGCIFWLVIIVLFVWALRVAMGR